MLERTRFLTLGLVLALLSPAPVFAAGPLPDAKTLYGEGVALFKTEDFEGAAAKFQAAYNIDPSPILLYNLARAAEESGKVVIAIQHFEAYLAQFKKAEDRSKVERKVRVLKAIRRNTMRGFLILEDVPENSRVYIDDALKTPDASGRWPIEPGPHTVRVAPENGKEWLGQLEPKAGQTVTLTYVGDVAPGDGLSNMAIGGWSSIGVGAVLLGVGGYYYSAALGSADDYDALGSEIGALPRNVQRDVVDGLLADRATAKDDVESSGTMAYVMWGVGAAAIASGAVLLVLDSDEAPGTSTVLVPTLGGFGVVGHF